VTLRLIDAKNWVRTYVIANQSAVGQRTFNRKLNWEIVKLSHDVFRGHGLRGHLIRQKIRRQLWRFASVEVAKVRTPSFFSRLKLFLLGHY
jgi:hypothetical protein